MHVTAIFQQLMCIEGQATAILNHVLNHCMHVKMLGRPLLVTTKSGS